MFALTPRLTLRPVWPEDAPRIAEAIGDEAVALLMAGDPRFAIVERIGHRHLIGGIGIARAGSDRHGLECWLTPDARGRGLATEAANAVIDVARHALGLQHLIARPPAGDPAAARVLQKLGFRESGAGLVLDLRPAVPAADLVAA